MLYLLLAVLRYLAFLSNLDKARRSLGNILSASITYGSCPTVEALPVVPPLKPRLPLEEVGPDIIEPLAGRPVFFQLLKKPCSITKSPVSL